MAVYDSFKTNRHRYTRHVQPFGPDKYKKDGKWISRQAFNGARAHVVERLERQHVNRTRDQIPTSKPQDIVARKDEKGRWRAGPEAHLYMDNIREGQFLGPNAVFKLRNTRWLANNFNSFWDANNELTREEAIKDHIIVSDLLEKARTTEEKQAILTAWGWGAY